MSQILLEAFNSIPYPTERTEKNGMMDISYTFEDETNHSFRFHFEKRVNYGRNVFVLTLGQKSPNIKMYKRVFGKFHNPLRVIATLIDIVKDNRQKRSDVKGLIIEVPEQAFGAHGRLVDKIIKRELRTELKVQDLELSIEEFEKMGLKGVVATVKPYQFDSVFNGKIMKDILDKRSEGGQSAEITPVSEKPVEVRDKDEDLHSHSQKYVAEARQFLDKAIKNELSQSDYDVTDVAFVEFVDPKSGVTLYKFRLTVKKNGKVLERQYAYVTATYAGDKVKVDRTSVVNWINSAEDKTNGLDSSQYEQTLEFKKASVTNPSFKYELLTDERYDIRLRFGTDADAKRAFDILIGAVALQYGNDTMRLYSNTISSLKANATGRQMDAKVARIIELLGNPTNLQKSKPDTPNINISTSNGFKAQATYDGSFKSGFAYEVVIDTNGLKDEKDFVEVLGEYGFELHGKTGTDYTFAFSADNDVQNALQNASNTLKYRKVGELKVLPIDFSCAYVAKSISSGYALCLSTEQEMRVANQIILASGIEDISTSVGFGQGEDKYRIVTTDASKSENILKKVYTLLGKPQEIKQDVLSGSTSESATYKTKDGFDFEVSGRKLTFKADINFNSIMDYVFGWFKSEFDTIDSKRQFVAKTDNALSKNFIGVLEKLSITEAISKKVAEQFDTIISKTYREYDLSTTMYERSIGAPEGQISDYREFKGEVVINDNGTAFAVFTSNTGPFVKSTREQFGSVDFEVNGNLNTLKVPLDGNFSIKEFDAGLVGKFLKAHDDNYGVLSKRFNPVKVIKPGRVTFQPSKNYASLSLKQEIACYLVGLEKYQQYSKVSSVVGFENINTIDEFYSLCEVLDNYDFEGNFLKAFRCSKYISDARANGGELKIDKNGKELKVTISDDMIIINIKGMKLPKINTPFWNEGDESALLKTYYMGHKKFNDALAVLDNFLDKELSEATTSEIAGADDISTVEQKFHLEHQKGGFKIVTTSPLATMLLLNDLQLDLTDNKDGSVYVKLSRFSKTVGTKKQVVNALTAVGYVEGEHVATPGSAASTPKAKQAETPKAPVIPKQSGELEVVVSLYSSMDTDYINVKDGELSLQTGYTKRTDGFYRYAPKGMTYSDGEKYVKDEILRMYNSGASNNAIKAKFEEMIGQRGRVIDVRGERANSNAKDIKRPIATALEKLKTVGDSKKLTGLDLSVGITKTYNGQTGTVGVVYYVAGNKAQIDEIYKEMRSSVVYTGFVGFFEVEFTEPYSKKKFKAKFTEQGVEIPSGMQTHIGNGRYVSVTQAGITKTVADSFSNGSPDAVVNDYMAYVGISNWMYTIKKTNLVKAIFLKYDINAIKSLKSVKVGMMNEGIKEDLTGVAPKVNKVDKSLLEKSMRQLGMYQSSFAYGGSTFTVSMNEGVVDILPTSGNVAYLSKMLGVKLGQDLVQDERGGLRFDIA